jgi:hypothetical protein
MTVKQLTVKLAQKKDRAAKMTADLKSLREEIKEIADELKVLKQKEGDQKKAKVVSKKKK